MPRVVPDTSVVLSALLTPGGLENQMLTLVLAGMLQMCVSEAILDKYADILANPKFRLPPGDVRLTLAKIRDTGTMVHPSRTPAISKHEPDNRFLKSAVEAEAICLS